MKSEQSPTNNQICFTILRDVTIIVKNLLEVHWILCNIMDKKIEKTSAQETCLYVII